MFVTNVTAVSASNRHGNRLKYKAPAI